MAKRKQADDEFEEEFEDEYEEEYEEGSWVDAFSGGASRRVVLVPLILILFGFGVWFAWRKYSDTVWNHPAYALDPAKIEYTQPPEWLKRDILSEVIKFGSLESKRISDQNLTVQVRNAFAHHPWVKRVERIRIHYPASLEVLLQYRKPVAFVALPDDDPTDDVAFIWPIDGESTVLPPEDFTPEFAQTFRRIDVGATVRTGADGSPWGDELVADGAKIAELLYEDWDSLRDVLYQIEQSSLPASTSDRADFDIVGRPSGGSRGLVVHWGCAPGKEQAFEPTAKAKLEKLKELVNEARLSGQLPYGEYDLRSVRALQAARHDPLTR